MCCVVLRVLWHCVMWCCTCWDVVYGNVLRSIGGVMALCVLEMVCVGVGELYMHWGLGVLYVYLGCCEDVCWGHV